uniref:Mitochondrial elongation factor 2 n=1 Tax=Anser brachyrhynchus TaxID=132585 RepID=A0A8B9CEN4_9AVES
MEFTHKRGKRQDDSGLGSVLDVLLANARLVLGVSGAAVLAIATLAVKRLIDRATSPRDEGDPKAEQKTLEESWQDLALIKATQKPPKRQRREDLSEPLLSPAPPPAPGDAPGPPHLRRAAELPEEQVPGAALRQPLPQRSPARRPRGSRC